MSAPELSRRSAAALLGLGVAASRLKAAQAALNALRRDPAEAKLQFFTPAQHELLDALTEMILPADEHSPGAHAAAVGKYIDLVVANSTPETQAAWRANLAAFEAFAGQAGKPFLRAAPAQRAKVLEQLAARAARPGTPAEHFFAQVREMTIFGYYSSEIGLLKELGYKGNQVLAAFPGCHSAP
ncbi:MAG TPA: gluconate 2-dehydrogenase subunit 3 family protein [Bryobacteraceae bacterium]|nr:gluconate 2-dehydrogenase subunit 3 family protein [Bryobacteraceae bacterium]